MHEMDCENCKHGEVMKAGSYKTMNGTIINFGKDSMKCTCDTVRTMNMQDGKIYCSNFEAVNQDG